MLIIEIRMEGEKMGSIKRTSAFTAGAVELMLCEYDIELFKMVVFIVCILMVIYQK